MDDEALFGPVLRTYSFRWGIADGWLKDYRIVVAALADSQVAELLVMIWVQVRDARAGHIRLAAAAGPVIRAPAAEPRGD